MSLLEQEMNESEENPEYDDEQDSSEKPPEIPKEKRNLIIQTQDRLVKDIVASIRDNSIVIEKIDFQRNFLWDTKKSSLLIESLLLNIPIPPIYLSEDENMIWSVIDGLQRLTSLKNFYNNEFKLRGLEVLTELEGKYYSNGSSSLPPKYKNILDQSLLRMIVIKHGSHPDIKFDVFARINKGSVHLNDQELRNCIYRGQFNDLLKELRNNKNFLNILSLTKPHKRFYDCELILRYFALSDKFDFTNLEVKDYAGSMKVFLNNYMESLSDTKIKQDKINLKKYKEKFESTIDKVYAVFGEKAFRKVSVTNGNITYEGRINRSLLDVICLSFEKVEKEKLINQKENIVFFLANMIQEPEFLDSITSGTSDSKKLNKRLKIWFKNFHEKIQL